MQIEHYAETDEYYACGRWFENYEDAEAYLESKEEQEGERKLMDLEWGVPDDI